MKRLSFMPLAMVITLAKCERRCTLRFPLAALPLCAFSGKFNATITKIRRKTKGYRKTAISSADWSGRRDSNPRPQRPKRCALPDCATPRQPRIDLANHTRKWSFCQVGAVNRSGPSRNPRCVCPGVLRTVDCPRRTRCTCRSGRRPHNRRRVLLAGCCAARSRWCTSL
jgi:hypothetical protein